MNETHSRDERVYQLAEVIWNAQGDDVPEFSELISMTFDPVNGWLYESEIARTVKSAEAVLDFLGLV